MVVYTGPDTKLVMNQGQYRAKISSFAKQLNILLAINIAIMLSMAIFMSQVGTRFWIRNNHKKHYYIYDAAEGEINIENYSFKALMSYYLLLNGLLPLDLAVTLMMSKLFVIFYVQSDHHMVDFEKSCADGEPSGCEVKNMMMLEDLSKINQIFCDKTGTLTKNELIFKTLAVGTYSFEVDDFEKDFSEFKKKISGHQQENMEQFLDFWRCLSVCHDVVQYYVEGDQETKFTGSSLDEITFLEMCKDVGFG